MKDKIADKAATRSSSPISVVVWEKMRRKNTMKKPFLEATKVQSSRYGGHTAKSQVPIINGKQSASMTTQS